MNVDRLINLGIPVALALMLAFVLTPGANYHGTDFLTTTGDRFLLTPRVEICMNEKADHKGYMEFHPEINALLEEALHVEARSLDGGPSLPFDTVETALTSRPIFWEEKRADGRYKISVPGMRLDFRIQGRFPQAGKWQFVLTVDRERFMRQNIRLLARNIGNTIDDPEVLDRIMDGYQFMYHPGRLSEVPLLLMENDSMVITTTHQMGAGESWMFFLHGVGFFGLMFYGLLAGLRFLLGFNLADWLTRLVNPALACSHNRERLLSAIRALLRDPAIPEIVRIELTQQNLYDHGKIKQGIGCSGHGYFNIQRDGEFCEVICSIHGRSGERIDGWPQEKSLPPLDLDDRIPAAAADAEYRSWIDPDPLNNASTQTRNRRIKPEVLIRHASQLDREGKQKEAIAAWKEILALYRRTSISSREIYSAEGALAMQLQRSGYPRDALQHYLHAAHLCQQAGRTDVQLEFTIKAGFCYVELKHDERARSLLEEAEALARTLEDRYSLGVILGQLGAIAFRADDLKNAENCYRRSREVFEEELQAVLKEGPDFSDRECHIAQKYYWTQDGLRTTLRNGAKLYFRFFENAPAGSTKRKTSLETAMEWATESKDGSIIETIRKAAEGVE